MEQEYQDITRPREVREEAKKLRKKFLRYQEAEVVYSISPSTRLTERWFLSGVISLSRISENSTGKPEEDRDWRKRMKAADKEKTMAKMERRRAHAAGAVYKVDKACSVNLEIFDAYFQTFRLDEGGR